MENLENRGIGQQRLQPRGAVIAADQLNQMGCVVAPRQLHEAQAVTMGLEPEGFCINRDGSLESNVTRQIAFVQLDPRARHQACVPPTRRP
jgi:hypothetical protein